MKIKKPKRIMSLFLAALMCVTSLVGIGTTAYAAEETDDVYLVSFPRDGDSNYNAEWGHSNLSLMNGWKTGTSRYTTVRAMGSYNGNICYCIEIGVPQQTGDSFTKKGEDFWDNYPSSYNSTISPDDIKLFIGRIFQYGYTGTISTSWRSQNEGGDKLAHAVATQLLIWETVIGERDENFNKVSTGGKDAVLDQISPNHPLYDKIMSYYNSMAASVQKHSKLPSFLSKTPGSAQEIELEWDGSKYTVTLTDSNNVLSGYKFSSNDSGVQFSVSGNKLTITAEKAPSAGLTITAEKTAQRKGVITWTDGIYGPNGGVQDTVTYAQTVNDPVKGFLKLKVSYGSAKIVKTSEDGKVEGIIIDPEREYSQLVKALGGEVIHISATSQNHINAMDMTKEYGDGANPVILKSEFIMSLCEQLIGGSNLGAKQKSIIDRCTASVYRTYQQNNYQGEVPTLQDFREELLKQDEPEAQEIALAIELFTSGSLNTFAKHTNVDTNNRLICYDILDLGKQLMPIGMLVVLDSILNRITQNRAKGRNTFIFIDEIYLLFQHEYSANFLFTLWKRVRKYGAYATGITQNVDDLLQSHTARTMLANSEFIIMLNQASTDRLELAKLLNISDLQMSYITNVEAGHGLIKVGSSLVPFANKFPKNTKLYKLMTTKPNEKFL